MGVFKSEMVALALDEDALERVTGGLTFQLQNVVVSSTSMSGHGTAPVEQTLNIGSQSSGAGAGKVAFNPF